MLYTEQISRLHSGYTAHMHIIKLIESGYSIKGIYAHCKNMARAAEQEWELLLKAENEIGVSDATEAEHGVYADVSNWVAYDWNDISSRPPKYGKYFVHRKDGKVHWETWNGSGWAYNEKVITHWQEVKPPCC